MKSHLQYRFTPLLCAIGKRWLNVWLKPAIPSSQSSENRHSSPTKWIPRVRTLEPRIVLNATAELVAFGDLVISGDGADDLVDVTLNAADRIEIFDANSAVIPIRIGTDPMGNPILVDSLDPNQISSGRLSVNLGGGDDTLRVDLAENLNLTVVDDDGVDSVDVKLNADPTGTTNSTLLVESETITIDGSGVDVDLSTSLLQSNQPGGVIEISKANSLTLGDIAVDQGTLRIDSIDTDITQAAGTSIAAERLDVIAGGDVELSQDTNSIGVVDRIRSGGDVDLTSDVTTRTVATMTIHRIETNSGVLPGEISIDVQGSVNLVSYNTDSDSVLTTANGEIFVAATDNIRISDFVSGNDNSGATADHEIIAGGDNGRINMQAGAQWLAADGVQLHASQITAGAVRIEAPSVTIGNNFEINTGNGIGIARRFAPRPEVEVFEPGKIRPIYPGLITDPENPDFVKIETAFYDPDSIQTNILTQANANDAEGVLSIDIGATGENGLTLSIDWGGHTNRFQTLENLLGDGTRVDVAHVYSEQDILNSTLNGRPSATDPLAVRFSVSHHQSIVITGDSIEQSVAPDEVVAAGGATLRNEVAGRMLSSTDNPSTTPTLENGRAFFVIPRIDVPLAFFPVRNVIPAPIDLVPPVILTTSVQLTNVTFETAEASASPASIREEYFQLRALSPDPDGEDLTEPIRLPENILAEDRLDVLFSELPDGAYEIQYVIGDNDQRAILRVDLRGGKAVIMDDDMETGTLELELIESEADDDSR